MKNHDKQRVHERQALLSFISFVKFSAGFSLLIAFGLIAVSSFSVMS